MDAHVSLEALEKFKQILTQFSKNMSVEAQKLQLHLHKTYNQLQQKHYQLKKQVQICQDPISYDQAKQQLIQFERLFIQFCEASRECIKGFQQQELIAVNQEKVIVAIDRKVDVLERYLTSSHAKIDQNKLSKDNPQEAISFANFMEPVESMRYKEYWGYKYAEKAPIKIPRTAQMKIQSKSGYDQISYKWSDKVYKYEVRWHTRTPGAPKEQGNTWVIQKTIPGQGARKPASYFLVGKNEWIEGYKWYAAISARRSGTATPQQINILDQGHWPAP